MNELYEMACYTYLWHITDPRCYAVPPNYAVICPKNVHPKNRVEWGDYCTSKWPKTSEKLIRLKRVGRKNLALKNREIGGIAK